MFAPKRRKWPTTNAPRLLWLRRYSFSSWFSTICPSQTWSGFRSWAGVFIGCLEISFSCLNSKYTSLKYLASRLWTMPYKTLTLATRPNRASSSNNSRSNAKYWCRGWSGAAMWERESSARSFSNSKSKWTNVLWQYIVRVSKPTLTKCKNSNLMKPHKWWAWM